MYNENDGQHPSFNTFYIVIDYDKPVDEDGEQYHTYFLNMVDEACLLYTSAIFSGWSSFLNYFDSSLPFQLSFINRRSHSRSRDVYKRQALS